MSLQPGARLGPYEIIGSLGVGGMCEVYRARDTRLKGDVALETLPESFASDPDRLARFQREGKRFLVIRSGTDLNGTSAQLIVVQHFDQELSRIVPSK